VIIVSLLGVLAIGLRSPGTQAEKSEVSAPKKRVAPELAVPVPDSDCASCGTVEAIRIFEVRGNVTGLRAGAGGSGGALNGNDRGSGKGGLTTLGAGDGALAGSEIENNAQKRVRYRVTVRMDDASFRTVSQSTAPSVAVGDRVRIANGALVARY
jgi:outer membrane lipoprotein SlyB